MIKIKSSGTKVAISIKADLDAVQLENLISELAVSRAALRPQVPLNHNHVSEDTNFSIQDDPYFTVARRRDGRIRFWIRSAGLGWMGFNVPIDKACGVRDYLTANLPATEGMPNLISKSDGHRDKPH